MAVIPANAASASAPSKVDARPTLSREEITKLLFPRGDAPKSCDAKTDVAEAAECLLSALYGEHDAGPIALYREAGSVAGLLDREETMDGGFRGSIRLVPELPIRQYQKHLDWVLFGQRETGTFLTAIAKKAGSPVRYRYEAISFRFMRSVGRTTPSAYAAGWEVAYNVSGSLHASKEAVRDTLFHEIFHLNDRDHAGWSRRVLGKDFDGIVAKCGTKTACLAPYAPMKTMVRGGTFYAFQPDNGDAVNEYAAELASRYYLETTAALAGTAYAGPAFKCGPAENARSWAAIAKEFFGDVDLVPACGSPR